MKVVKYLGQKLGGMPVHFPVCCKHRGMITHHKVANPYLELEDAEATLLVKTDPNNFELADKKEYADHVKEHGEPEEVPFPGAKPQPKKKPKTEKVAKEPAPEKPAKEKKPAAKKGKKKPKEVAPPAAPEAPEQK